MESVSLFLSAFFSLLLLYQKLVNCFQLVMTEQMLLIALNLSWPLSQMFFQARVFPEKQICSINSVNVLRYLYEAMSCFIKMNDWCSLTGLLSENTCILKQRKKRKKLHYHLWNKCLIGQFGVLTDSGLIKLWKQSSLSKTYTGLLFWFCAFAY